VKSSCSGSIVQNIYISKLSLISLECVVGSLFLTISHISFILYPLKNILTLVSKQAGAELCQAQDKLGLAKPALPRKKLRSSSIQKYIEVVLHQQTTNCCRLPTLNKWMSSSICKHIDTICYFCTKKRGCLIFLPKMGLSSIFATKIMRSSSICLKIEIDLLYSCKLTLSLFAGKCWTSSVQAGAIKIGCSKPDSSVESILLSLQP
jgi:hypothetical protein